MMYVAPIITNSRSKVVFFRVKWEMLVRFVICSNLDFVSDTNKGWFLNLISQLIFYSVLCMCIIEPFHYVSYSISHKFFLIDIFLEFLFPFSVNRMFPALSKALYTVTDNYQSSILTESHTLYFKYYFI